MPSVEGTLRFLVLFSGGLRGIFPFYVVVFEGWEMEGGGGARGDGTCRKKREGFHSRRCFERRRQKLGKRRKQRKWGRRGPSGRIELRGRKSKV